MIIYSSGTYTLYCHHRPNPNVRIIHSFTATSFHFLYSLTLLYCLYYSVVVFNLLLIRGRAIHSEEYCAMYDICGQRSDGKVLNCPYPSPSVKPADLLSAKIQSLCPSLNGNVCCTEQQFDTLRVQVQQAVPILVGCPACLRNFLNLFCELSCSPNQSLFINVTSVSQVINTHSHLLLSILVLPCNLIFVILSYVHFRLMVIRLWMVLISMSLKILEKLYINHVRTSNLGQ
jgi:hypothetical protein